MNVSLDARRCAYFDLICFGGRAASSSDVTCCGFVVETKRGGVRGLEGDEEGLYVVGYLVGLVYGVLGSSGVGVVVLVGGFGLIIKLKNVLPFSSLENLLT